MKKETSSFMTKANKKNDETKEKNWVDIFIFSRIYQCIKNQISYGQTKQ